MISTVHADETVAESTDDSTGWDEKDGSRYYFDLTYGTMAKGDAVIDGVTYHFDVETGILK